MWRKKVVIWNQVVDLGPEILVAIALSLLVGLLLGRLTVDREPIVVTAPQNGAERAIVVTNPPIRPIQAKVTCEDRTRTVVERDTLWDIARNEYGGRGYLYPLIAEASKISNPDRIRPNQVLVIPCDLSKLPEQRVASVASVRRVESPVINTAKTSVKTWQEALGIALRNLKEKGIDLDLEIKPEPLKVSAPVQDPAFLDSTKLPLSTQPAKEPPQPFLEPYKGLPGVPPEPDHPPQEGVVLPKPQDGSPPVVPRSFPSRRVFPRR